MLPVKYVNTSAKNVSVKIIIANTKKLYTVNNFSRIQSDCLFKVGLSSVIKSIL